MKRILVSLLLFSLFLSSCESTVHEHTDIDTEIDTALAVSTPVFNIDGELPDIGEFTGNKPQERFYEEYTPDFIPSDEYGELIPFIGNKKTYTKTFSYDTLHRDHYSYGLCTANGKIVMDASSEVIGIKYYETNDGFEYYVIERRVDITDENAYDDFKSTTRTVIPKNGTWCIDLDPGIYAYAENGTIATSETITYNSDSIIEIFDYNANKLAIIEGARYLDHSAKFLIIETSEYYYYANKNGEIVLGPYLSAGEFSIEGIAGVRKTDGNWCLIDKKGNEVSDDKYSQIRLHSNKDDTKQYFSAKHKSSSLSNIFYNTGKYWKTVKSQSSLSMIFLQNDKTLYLYDDPDFGYVYKNLKNDNLLRSKEYGFSPNTYHNRDGIFVYDDDEANFVLLMDGDGDTVATVDSLFTSPYISQNRRFLILITGDYNSWYDDTIDKIVEQNTKRIQVYDTEKNEFIYISDSDGDGSFAGENDRYIIIHIYGISQDDVSVEGYYFILDTETNNFLFENSEYIEHKSIAGKSYYNVCTKNSCTLYDEDFNVILRNYNE